VTIEDVIGEVVKILAASGIGWPALIAAIVVVAVAVLAFKQLPKGESGPPPENNETPAPGSPLPTDPANPGGGPTGGMG